MSSRAKFSLSLGLVVLLGGALLLVPRTKFLLNQEVSNQTMDKAVTNQWFSSLYFSKWSSPLFAFPLAYQLSAEGLQVSYPQVTASENTVFASFVPQLTIGSEHPYTAKTIKQADPVSVTVETCNQTQCTTSTLAHGLPVVHQTVNKDGVLKLTYQQPSTITLSPTTATIAFPTANYIVGVYRQGQWLPLNNLVNQSKEALTFNLKQGDRLSLGLQPENGSLTIEQLAPKVTSTSVAFSDDPKHPSTTLTYHTSSGQPLVALLPHQWKDVTTTPLGTYTTLRGTMKLYTTNTIVQTLTAPQVLTIADMVKSLSPEQTQKLTAILSGSATKVLTETPHQTVYDAGKQVFKLALLSEIAATTKHPEAGNLQRQLATILTSWLATDPATNNPHLKQIEDPKGVVATTPQFGNEVFNDHHFHYGYFLASAGILIELSPEYATTLKPGITALIQDIGNLDTQNGYPFLRGFDVYESHSWADGHATTGDGNNQESTSEAINRWYGLLRVGIATHDIKLTNVARHGLSMEQFAAQTYWLGQKPDLFQFPTGYTHPIASLVWGGKADFATWFSSNPSHIYGIQFLPSSPAMTHTQSLETWKLYTDYQPSTDTTAWNDIQAMSAITNGVAVPQEQSRYETGNTAAWYYLWTSYWANQTNAN